MPPIKSISVVPTKRGGLRKQPSPTVGATDGPLSIALARPARRTMPQATHRYRVGERLHMSGGGNVAQRAASACKIVALLPYEGYGALLYRVRSDTESFERIVAEADLAR